LLARLPRRAAPPLEASRSTRLPPPGDTSIGFPRDDQVDADLGHQGDGELTSIAFRQSLDDDELWVRHRHFEPAFHGDAQPVADDLRDPTIDRGTVPIGDPQRLTDSQPTDGGGMSALGPVEDNLIEGAIEGIDEEDRRSRRRHSRRVSGR
jgi:hypothetical protein